MGEPRFHRCGGCKQMLDGVEYPAGSTCPHCSSTQTQDDLDRKYRGSRPQAFDEVLLKSEFDGIERTVARRKKMDIAAFARETSKPQVIKATLLAACIPVLLYIVNPMVYRAFTVPVFAKAIYVDDNRETLTSLKTHFDRTGETPGGEANALVLRQAESTLDDVLGLLDSGVWITRAVGTMSGAVAGLAFGALLLFIMNPTRSRLPANIAAVVVLVSLLGINGSTIRYRVVSDCEGYEFYRPAMNGMMGFLTAGAILDRDTAQVERLLFEGAPLDFRDENGAGYLHFAADANAVGVIGPLLGENRLQVDNEDNHGDTPLVYAVRSGHTQVAHALIVKGADWRRADDGPRPLMHLAAAQEDVGLLKLLLEYEASPDRLDSEGRTPIMIAAEQGNEIGLALLLERHADVDLVGEAQATLLQQTLAEVLAELESAKRRVNWEDIDGVERLGMLLEHGANVNLVDSDGLSALHHVRFAFERAAASDANRFAFGRIADMMLAKGARPDMKDASGAAAYRLVDAAVYGHVRWAKDLIRNNSSAVGAPDATGKHPLQIAIENRQLEFSQFLLEQGADVATWVPSTGNALCFAARTGQLETAQRLLQHGLGPKTADTSWESPILIAAKRGDTKMVALLLEHGFDVNRQNTRGDTPLHFAVKAEDVETVRLLLSSDADPTLWNKAGDTPLRLARRKGDRSIIAALRRSGVQTSGGR